MSKIVHVVHYRCGEWDGTETFYAPDSFTEEEIEQKVRKVSDEMITDAKLVKESPARVEYLDWNKQDQDKTIRQIKSEFEEKKKNYDNWKKENSHLTRSFACRMIEVGFHTNDIDKVPVEIDNYWGHHHGLTLNYGKKEPIE